MQSYSYIQATKTNTSSPAQYQIPFKSNDQMRSCLSDAAKRGFYRAFNSIFGKIGHIASEEVILQQVSTKCIPILLYGLEVLPSPY